MTCPDFTDFLKIIVPDYADDLCDNYYLSREDALLQAKSEINALLTGGAATPGQVLLSIYEDSPEGDYKTGYFWYSPDLNSGAAFLYNFYIFPDHRNKGLGKKALAMLEKHLADQGIRQIKLRVAADNGRAKHVYETAGYRVTGFNMNKSV